MDIFHLKEGMTCKGSELVYVVIYSSCKEELIGKTGIEKNEGSR